MITSGKARILQIALAEKINGPLDWHFIETYAGCFSRRPGKITFHKAPVQLFNIIPQGTFFPQFQLVITLCLGTQWLMNLVILAWLVKLHIVYYLYSYKCPLCCFNLPKILASITFSSSRFQKEYFKIFLRKIKGLSLTETKICRVSPPDSASCVFLSWKQDRGGWLEGSHRNGFPGNIYLLSPLPFHTDKVTQFLILLTSRSNVCVYFLFFQLNWNFS